MYPATVSELLELVVFVAKCDTVSVNIYVYMSTISSLPATAVLSGELVTIIPACPLSYSNCCCLLSGTIAPCLSNHSDQWQSMHMYCSLPTWKIHFEQAAVFSETNLKQEWLLAFENGIQTLKTMIKRAEEGYFIMLLGQNTTCEFSG